MTSEHELQEPGNLGEVLLENSSPLNLRKIGELRILYGLEPCLILFVSTRINTCAKCIKMMDQIDLGISILQAP